jgi:ABC-type transport system substrate-binding protein
MDRSKRAEYYKRLQEIVHEEIPYIFIHNMKERIVVNKKFDNVYGTPARPGYWVGGFRTLEAQ